MAIKNTEYESYLLELEDRIAVIANQVGQQMISNRSISEQFDIIEMESGSYYQENISMTERLKQLETQLAVSSRFAEESQSGNAQRIAQLNELLAARIFNRRITNIIYELRCCKGKRANKVAN